MRQFKDLVFKDGPKLEEVKGTPEKYVIIGHPVGGLMEEDITEMMLKLQENQ